MASKHAKLKLALTRAIIDFFLQEDLYADELKIQGTVCVTADRSAIFVTQITETVNESFSQDAGPSVYTSDASLNHYRHSEDSPEDLTCKSGPQRRCFEATPPIAHTKAHQPTTAIHKNSPFGKHGLSHHSPSGGAHNKSDWSQHPPSLGNAFCGDFSRDSGQDLSGGCASYSSASLSAGRIPLLENDDRPNNQLLTLNNAILNAAAKSAIERLTSLNRDREKAKALASPRDWAEGKDASVGSLGKKNSLDIQRGHANHDKESVLHDVIDCSSAKKRRLDNSSILRVDPQPLDKPTVCNNSDLDDGGGGGGVSHEVTLDTNSEEPLMLVTPKRERLSDDECDQEADNDKSNLSALDTDANKSLPPGGLDLSPPSDSSRKEVSPPGGNSQSASSSAPWTFTVASMKEEPGTLVTEWSSADWMRKPRTKFSQEQLQALEMEYKNDPFLSTSADKRAELARRLNITEKNVQIWFQNQRRRRRAAAYSQMHYTLGDAKTPTYNSSNNVEEATDTTPGSPELVSDHDDSGQFVPSTEENNGDTRKDGTSGVGEREGVEEEEGRPDSCSLDDSSCSELVIATDLSPPPGEEESQGSEPPEEASQAPEKSQQGEELCSNKEGTNKKKSNHCSDQQENASPDAKVGESS